MFVYLYTLYIMMLKITIIYQSTIVINQNSWIWRCFDSYGEGGIEH